MTAAVTAIVGVVLLAVAAIGAVTWAVRVALERADRAAAAEVRAAGLEADVRIATATADTADRLRRAETARADALDEELSHRDQTQLDAADPDARRRVLARWRDANAAAAPAPAGGDGEGPVSDPSQADAAG